MARELPLDVILEVFDFVHLMELRAASREWHEAAPKQITTLGLIDDLENGGAWRRWRRSRLRDLAMDVEPLWWRGKYSRISSSQPQRVAL